MTGRDGIHRRNSIPGHLACALMILGVLILAGLPAMIAPAAAQQQGAQTEAQTTGGDVNKPAVSAEPAGEDPAQDAESPSRQGDENADTAPSAGDIVEETIPNDVVRPSDEVRTRVAAMKLELDHFESTLQRGELSDSELKELSNQIDVMTKDILSVQAFLAPLIKEIDQRIAQLGPEPQASDPPETERIKARRREQTALQSEIHGAAKEARLISVRAAQLANTIWERRRILFAERIFERRRTILSLSFWREFATALPVGTDRIGLLGSDWIASVKGKIDGVILSVIALILLITLALIPISLRISRWIESQESAILTVSRFRKVVYATWAAASLVAIPGLATGGIYWVMQSFGLFSERIDVPARALVEAVLLFSAAYGLCYAFLVPGNHSWRLAYLPDSAARRTFVLTVSAAGIFALDHFLSELNTILFVPLPMTIGESALADLVIALLMALALRTISTAHTRQETEHETPPSTGMVRWRWVQFVIWLAILAIPAAQIFGFLSLSQFIAKQLVVTNLIIGATVLSMMLIDELLSHGINNDNAETRVARQIIHSLGMPQSRVDLLTIFLSGILKVTVLLLALTLLLVPWGYESKDVYSWFRSVFFGFTFGDMTISMSSILTALGVFVVVMILTRMVQRWLEVSFLPHTELDIGIQNSLKTALGYVGILLAAAVGISYLGFDLTNLAIVAGALSLGIGFGLQSVVNNFVSGLILLVERPIKTGDWIIVGEHQGYVRRISVRSTEIETFDSASVIVPNSDLISGVVTNWMHVDMKGRIRVPIGVAYDSDPQQVQDILLEVANNHPSILKHPSPNAFFLDFGASSLDFELRAHVRFVDTGLTVKSELRTQILQQLRAANIEIPFPQQDIHLRDINRLETAMGPSSQPRGRKPVARTKSAKGTKGKS